MKLKMKEWMERMTKAVKPSTCTEVTLPFTPPCNGLLIGLVRASAQGRFYLQLTNAMPGIIDAYQVAYGYCVGAVFVTKNKKVEQSGSSNIFQTIYYFIPLVGGVLRNPVISTLTAIFTSLLFGGDVDEDLGEGDVEQVTPKRAEEDYYHGYDYINRGVGYSFKVSRQSSIRPLLHICNEPCIQTRCNIPHCDVAGWYGRYVDSESKHNGDGLCLDNRLTISERRRAA